MGLERRTFLQQAGLALLTLGMGETGIISRKRYGWLLRRIQPYQQTLAQTSQRKLALLVGINEYPQYDNLHGCVTDVELQKELLIARFGFNPKDILTLTNREATRENIETAFAEHLREQAKADDVVVFHFSGYGSKVKMPPETTETTIKEQDEDTQITPQLLDCLVPSDGILPTKGNPVANDLLIETLCNLGRSLSTNKLTMVLDTSFSSTESMLRGNLQVRSIPQISERPSPEELALREQLQIRLGNTLLTEPQPGIILLAAGKDQVATEAQWQGFSAGLFTHALTQYLWQATPASTIQIALQRTTATLEHFMGKQQKPTLVGSAKSLLAYYLLPTNTTGAEGIVTGIDTSGIVSLKLTGLPVKVLNNYGTNSCLTLVSLSSSTTATKDNICLQIRSREGLTAKAQIIGKIDDSEIIQPGQLVQELVRVFPRNLGLIVALDTNLERIERVDGTSAFANIPVVASVTLAGEHHADCLLGKVKQETVKLEETSQSSQEQSQSLPSYGLFSLGGTLIPNTVGKSNEAVKAAVSRLQPQLNTLLAAKWLDLTVNEGSSYLAVEATLELAGKYNSLLQQRATLRQASTLAESWDKLSSNNSLISGKVELPVLTKGTEIRFRLANYDTRDLYVMFLGIDSDGNAITLYAPQAKKIDDNNLKLKDIVLAPNQELIIPEPGDSFNWKVSGSGGIVKIYLIFSIAPFAKTLEVLSNKQNFKLLQEQILNIINPLEVTKGLLEDLHLASGVSSAITGTSTDVYALDVNSWATLSFVYEIVDS
jgi:hypothetical protein